MLLAERSRLSSSSVVFEGAFATSLIRLLAHERLLNEVETLIFRARPRYDERTDLLEMPRGRLREHSLLLSIATGVPRVESVFDELTMDTPLLQVIASALQVIASDRLPPKIAVLRPGIKSRAIVLLRHLSAVRLVGRETAIDTAERLWLGPLDRAWKPAIDAALPVLRHRAVVPEDGAESENAVTVHISMEKFWEQCLELAIESAFPSAPEDRRVGTAEGADVPLPWELRGYGEGVESKRGAYPDFLFRTTGLVVLADAKYKSAFPATLSSQDGYQLFAYSHLATLNGQPSDVGLVLYPAREGSPSAQLELERMRGRDYPLWLVTAPFPTPRDAQDGVAWGRFVSRLAHVLRDFSMEWSTARGAVA